MAYFELSFQNTPGQNVKARVTFPDDCYEDDGGSNTIPNGERVPDGNLGYPVFYNRRSSQNCVVGDIPREWTLPYTPNQSGSGLTVFLVERATGDVKDEKEDQANVVED